jgi:hypothetical protein
MNAPDNADHRARRAAYEAPHPHLPVDQHHKHMTLKLSDHPPIITPDHTAVWLQSPAAECVLAS